jgi:MFS-type transporter involved in bile tolerance (Atg22 family)
MIPIANGAIPALGAGRTAPLLLAPALFLICALPMLIWYNAAEQPSPPKEITKQSIRKTLQHLLSHKAIFLFLLAYFFYSDALLTFSSNYPLFLEKVHAI